MAGLANRPPPCLGVVKRVIRNFGDNDRPPSCKCDVWLGSMVWTRVRVPAREHRRTNYCSHVGLSMTPKRVSQHVRINRKTTLQEMCPAHGDGETKMAPNLQKKTVRDMRKNPAHHQDPRIESRPAQIKIAATICSTICICVCVWKTCKKCKKKKYIKYYTPEDSMADADSVRIRIFLPGTKRELI